MLLPGTLHAYAHARRTRDETGRWPSVRALARIAEDEEDCNTYPLIALARGELPLRDQEPRHYAWQFKFAPVEQAGVALLVPDAETLRCVTLYGEDRVRADLFTPWGRHMTTSLVELAERWEDFDQEQFERNERRREERRVASRE
jgi:hypothetical protein